MESVINEFNLDISWSEGNESVYYNEDVFIKVIEPTGVEIGEVLMEFKESFTRWSIARYKTTYNDKDILEDKIRYIMEKVRYED